MKTNLIIQQSLILFSALVLISSHSSLFAQRFGMQIDGYGNISLMIIDPNGQKTGYDITEDKISNEIPEANVGAAGIGILNEDGTTEDDPNSTSITAFVDNSIDGEYKIIVSGMKKTVFGVNVMVGHETRPGTNIVAGGFVDSLSVIEVSFSYDYYDKQNTNIKKSVTKDIFIKDIELCYHFKYIKDEGIFTSLRQKAENAIKMVENGNNNSACNILNAFINEVNAQKGKKIAVWEAEEVLIFDAEDLIKQWQNK